MTVEFFIAEYIGNKRSDATIDKAINTSVYVRYEDKVADCQAIASTSCWDSEDDSKFWLNSPIRWYMFVTRIISRYTKLEFSSDGGKMLEEFNSLEKENLTTKILAKILQNDFLKKEYNQYQTILEMTVNDMQQNYNSLPAKIRDLGDTFSAVIDEIMENPEVKELMSQVTTKQ